MNKKQKQILKTTIILTSVAAFLSLAMILVVNKKKSQNTNTIINEQTQNTIEGEKQIDTSNWETYTNPTYGFSFKYPKDMVKIYERDSSKYIDGYTGESNESIAKRLAMPDRINSVTISNRTKNIKKKYNPYDQISIFVDDKNSPRSEYKDIETFAKYYLNNYIANNDLITKGGVITEELTKTKFNGKEAYSVKVNVGEQEEATEAERFPVTYIFFEHKNNFYDIRVDDTNIFEEILNSLKLAD